MLVPATSSWRGTTGQIIRPGEFAAYLATIVFSDWTPQGVTIHNTAAPDGAQWDATVAGDDPVADAVQRAKNLTAYYRSLGWLGGPHFFIDDELAIGFNPLNKQGTHSRCFNSTRLGLEMVGDFDREAFDSGRGAKVRDLTVEMVAALCLRFGWAASEERISFHRDCAADNHACPGRNVKKAEFIARVGLAMRDDHANSHVVVDAIPPDPRAVLRDDAVKHLQTALNELGASPVLAVDGWPGAKTKAAMDAVKATF